MRGLFFKDIVLGKLWDFFGGRAFLLNYSGM